MILLVAVIGLPAVGKTSLCEFLVDQLVKDRVIHLKYDNYFCNDYLSLDELQSNHWKQCRDAILEGLEVFLEYILFNKSISDSFIPETKPNVIKYQVFNFLKSSCSFRNNENLILLIDDNFYYRSMRYDLFKLAKKFSLSFAIMQCQCSTAILTNRFLGRINNNVSSKSFMRINHLFEASKMAHWEKWFLVIDTNSPFESLIPQLLQFFEVCLQNPFNLISDFENFKVSETPKISLTHKLDILLRKCVSNIITTKEFANEGRIISKIKKEVYEEAKNDQLILTSLLYGENDESILKEIQAIFISKFQEIRNN